MGYKYLIAFSLLIFFTLTTGAQEGFKSEEDLKEKAEQLFEEKKLAEAEPLFAQLLSLYPQDPNYNYKYGACLLASSADKEKPLKYLNFAIGKGGEVEPLAYYYLGRAHHLNYNFGQAVKFYSRFKSKVSSDEQEEYMVDRQIEMCKNGNQLLSKFNEVKVLERQTINEKDFFRIYELEGIDGKIITKPAEFQTKYDTKIGESSIIYLPANANEVYFSSYGKRGEAGRDIFKTVKLGNRSWSDPVNLGPSINTPYDENYAFIHPDGRTLYFASKGHSSMGGYDLFKSTYDASIGNWTAPVNLDFAFSSADDDIMFVTDKDQVLAYFASNRTNESRKITVYKVLVEKAPADLTVIKGKFIAENQPEFKKAKITVVNQSTNQTVGVYETDENGNYQVEIPSNGGVYKFNIETTDDAPIHAGIVDIPRQDEFEVLGQELRLVGSGQDQQLVIKNIFDGTTSTALAGNGPQISAQTLRKKASLEVNTSEAQLESLASTTELADNPKDPLPENTSSKEDTDAGAGNVKDRAGEVQNESGSAEEIKTAGSEDKPAGNKESAISNANAQNLKARLNEVNNQYYAEIEREEQFVNAQYQRVDSLMNEAKAIFNEVENTGETSPNASERRREAQLLATEAALQLKLARELESEINQKPDKTEFAKQKQTIESSIENDDLAEAELKIADLQNQLDKSVKPERWLQREKTKVETTLTGSASRLTEAEQRNKNFQAEKQRLHARIQQLDDSLTNAEEPVRSEIQTSLTELQLDLKDMEFQLQKASSDYQELLNENEALAMEAQLLTQMEQTLANPDRYIAAEDMGSVQKEQLLTAVKNFQDNEQLLYQQESEISRQPSTELLSLNQIEERYALRPAEGTATAKLSALDEQLNTIDRQLSLRQQEIVAAPPERKAVLNQEIAQLQARRNEVQSKRSALADDLVVEQLADTPVVEDKPDAERKDEKPKSSAPSESTAVEKEEETEDVASSVDPEPIATVDIEQVTFNTPIPANLNTFNFQKEFEYANQENLELITDAKKDLILASDYRNQAEAARQAAYTLPTVEERSEAFTLANKLEQQAEELQVDAIYKYTEINQKEFERNANILNNLDEYDESFESSNLDIAELLEAEAENYFAQAQKIKDEEIKPGDYSEITESTLQEIYDLEMLALQKQKQAKDLLKIIDKEFTVQPTSAARASTGRNRDIQTITDAEVIAVANPDIAKERGDSLTALVVDINRQADSIKAEAEAQEVGASRDSLMATYQTLQKQSREAAVKAEVYYQREQQIRTGFEPTAGLGAGITQPAEVYTLSATIDTVNIDEEGKKGILNSRPYKQFLEQAINRQRLVKSAEVEYQKAIEIQKQQIALDREAEVLTQAAKTEKEETEKERMIKEARVIEQRADRMDESLDSLNKILKVKNYLIISADRKMKQTLAELPDSQRTLIEQFAFEQVKETQRPASKPDASLLAAKADATDTKEEEEREGAQTEELAEAPQEIIPDTEPASEETEIEDANEITEGIEEVEGLIAESSEDIEDIKEEQSEERLEEGREENKAEEITPSVEAEPDTKLPERPADKIAPESTDNQSTIKKPASNEGRVDPMEIIRSKPTSKINTSGEDINRIPRTLEQPIFMKLGLEESFYNSNKPIPLEKELPTGIVYKVQVGAFRNPIPQDHFKGFAPLMGEKGPNGITRFTAGLFTNERQAINARDQIRKVGYPDAFVVAFLNGKRISLAEARGQQSTSPAELADVSLPTSSTQTAGGSGSTNKPANENLPAEFSDPEVAEVIDANSIEDVYFTVQIGVYSKPVKKGTFDQYEQLNVLALPNGLIRYNTGIYKSPMEANNTKNLIVQDIPDAFVTAYYKGKRISMDEAARIMNQ
jgi:hypothetical protein